MNERMNMFKNKQIDYSSILNTCQGILGMNFQTRFKNAYNTLWEYRGLMIHALEY